MFFVPGTYTFWLNSKFQVKKRCQITTISSLFKKILKMTKIHRLKIKNYLRCPTPQDLNIALRKKITIFIFLLK